MAGAPVVSVGVPLAGRFVGGTETTGTDVPEFGQVWFTVVAWTGGFATQQDAVDGGALFGESSVWQQSIGGAPPAAPVPMDNPGEFTGLVITTPEPSVIALSGLGAAAILLHRRKLKK